MAFSNPAVEATDAARALRMLAHETRTIESPTQVYQAIGALSSAMNSLGQSLDQIADWHERNLDHAADDDGDRDAGRFAATVAALGLRDAADRARAVGEPLRDAHVQNGRIAWDHDQLKAAEQNLGRPLPPASAFGRPSAPTASDGLGR